MAELLLKASETAIVGSLCCLLLSGFAILLWCALAVLASWFPSLGWLFAYGALFLTMVAPWVGFVLGCVYVWSVW